MDKIQTDKINYLGDLISQILTKKAVNYEIIIILSNLETSRYANNCIIQNMNEEKIDISTKISSGKKLIIGNTSDITETGLSDFLRSLVNEIRFSNEIPFFEGFIENRENNKLSNLNMESSKWDSDQRADMITEIVSIVEKINPKVKLAGTCTVDKNLIGYFNSFGQKYQFNFVKNFFKVNAIFEENRIRGYGQKSIAWRKEKPDFLAITEEVVDTAVKTLKPIRLEHGNFKVVLSPIAVSELLSFIQFNLEANAFHEARSFATDSLGAQLFDEKFHLEDKPLDVVLSNYSFPFDREGVSTKNRIVIDKGTVISVPYNSLSASKFLSDKNLCTGNTPPVNENFSPNIAFFVSLIQKNGVDNIDDLVKDVRNGLYINSFHYTRYTDPRKGGLTGLTKNGLFQIRNGEIGPSVYNLRYTDSFLSIFGPENIISIGKVRNINLLNTTSPMALNKIHFSSQAHKMN